MRLRTDLTVTRQNPMANVFAILSAIALAAACFLALKNKDAYQAEIKARQDEEAKLRDLTGQWEEATKDYDATYAERVATQKENEGLRENETREISKNTALESEKTAKTTECM